MKELEDELRVLEDDHEDSEDSSVQLETNETINTRRSTDKYKTKDYWAKVKADLDTNDLYHNANKLKQLYKLIKDNEIPEERLSHRVQQKFKDLEVLLQNGGGQ